MMFTKLLDKSKNLDHISNTQIQTCENKPFISTETQLARKILQKVMRFRRIAGHKKSCATTICEACLAPHLPRVISAIEKRQPITFVLPAFPAKSPNPSKVLGTLPDMAERLALEFLNRLCQQIQTIYTPGAQIILCSDGRVFNDALDIRDIDVSDYQQALSDLITGMALTQLSVFNLDDSFVNIDFEKMRNELMKQYGEPLDILKKAVRDGSKSPCSIENKEANRQYCGITRFLVEDGTHPDQLLSRSALQKQCRQRAYIVVQRSRAWSNFVAEHFPDAVRLSIHPQTCGSQKLGIRLLEAESWMTPWHGVAMDVGDQVVLVKRKKAEELGAYLVYRHGRPSHYVLNNPNKQAKIQEVLREI